MTKATEIVRQHLIDPELCIRCNSCEENCPIGAISHDARNYVVDAARCDCCNSCISPCPTGAIDNWRRVERTRPWSLADQLAWDTLPEQEQLAAEAPLPLPDDVQRITDESTDGQGGPVLPPWSAAHPQVNLFDLANPALATVMGNHPLTAGGASADIRHLVLDFGTTVCPVLEGQSIGVVVPGFDTLGRAHHVRLYSVASPRDGERAGYNNLAITVKRVTANHAGRPVRGVASNYLCDLKKGDKVKVVGPYGASFLMPNHPGASLLMICTGTGAAPMRAMIERRRRTAHGDGARLMLFLGARAPAELPYFGPLMKLPPSFIDLNLAFSRLPGQARRYVQDGIVERNTEVMQLLRDDNSYIYVCGLKAMASGVEQALRTVCAQHGEDWEALLPRLRAQGRYHVETY